MTKACANAQPIATSADHVTERVVVWSAYSTAVKTEAWTTAWRSDDGWVVINPILLTDEAWAETFGEELPVAVFLTSETHERAAAEYQRRWKIPVCASAATAAELKVVDTILPEESHGLRVILIPGATKGETAFLSEEEGVLILGDAIINAPCGGDQDLALLPKKYCVDEKENRRSLEKLLDCSFHLVTFAHGTPLRTHARERIRALFA